MNFLFHLEILSFIKPQKNCISTVWHMSCKVDITFFCVIVLHFIYFTFVFNYPVFFSRKSYIIFVKNSKILFCHGFRFVIRVFSFYFESNLVCAYKFNLFSQNETYTIEVIHTIIQKKRKHKGKILMYNFMWVLVVVDSKISSMCHMCSTYMRCEGGWLAEDGFREYFILMGFVVNEPIQALRVKSYQKDFNSWIRFV